MLDSQIKRPQLKLRNNYKNSEFIESACFKEKLRKSGRITAEDFKEVKGRYNVKKLQSSLLKTNRNLLNSTLSNQSILSPRP